MANQDLKINF